MKGRRVIAAVGAAGLHAIAVGAALRLSSPEAPPPPRVDPLIVRLLGPPSLPSAPQAPQAAATEPTEPSATASHAPAPATSPLPPAFVDTPAAVAPKGASTRSRPPRGGEHRKPRHDTLPLATAPTLPRGDLEPLPPVGAQRTATVPEAVTADTDAAAAKFGAFPMDAAVAALPGVATGLGLGEAQTMASLTDGTRAIAQRAAATPVAEPRRTGPRLDANWAGNVAPAYPAAARRMGDQGEVRLDVHVAADGSVLEVRLRSSSGSALLDRSAVETVRRWRFTPASVDGEAVAEWYRDWKWVFRLEG
jgi:protein TonB